MSFRVRRPLAILNGTIDKLLVTANPGSDDLPIEIIDFKTNRISVSRPGNQAAASATAHGLPEHDFIQDGRTTERRGQQMALDFVHSSTIEDVRPRPSVADAVALMARDYQLQMQAYASAVRMLLPYPNKHKMRLKVTLHFLEPNVEYQLSDHILQEEVCNTAIDQAIYQIVSSVGPEHFPVNPAQHCRMCSFVDICPAGREWLVNRWPGKRN